MINSHQSNNSPHNSVTFSRHESVGSSVPAQTLFMDSHEVATRTNSSLQNSAYYQVATPKSPHELTSENETHQIDLHSETGGISHSGNHDSEDYERLKYDTAKSEIMSKLHLHTLITHKETQKIEKELARVDAQMTLLRKLHEDKDLKSKAEDRYRKVVEQRKKEFEEAQNALSSHFCDKSSLSFASGTSSFPPGPGTSSGSYYYQTRSKSHGNISEISNLRPAEPALLDMRMSGKKSLISSAVRPPELSFLDNQRPKSSLMNSHHRRNYSSTCVTSNSGVVGKNDEGKPIFRRYDGILVIITCSFCSRAGFTSAQGVVNHTRLKHSKTYSNQPLAVLNNQTILEDEKQDPEILAKFRKLKLNPQTDYLPNEVAFPNIQNKQTKSIPGSAKTPSPGENVPEQQNRSTKHLEKLCKDSNEFNNLLGMIDTTSKDLEVVLQQSESDYEASDAAGHSESEIEAGTIVEADDKSSSYSPSGDEQLHHSSSGESVSSFEKPEYSASPTTKSGTSPIDTQSSSAPPARVLRKRKNETEEQDNIKKRLRPAEKKARPDALAFIEIPEHEKRSSHYNLRAKSKLKGHNFE